MHKKNFAKFLSVFIMIALIFSSVSLSAFAGTEDLQLHFAMTADKTNVEVGDIVTFTVKLKGSETAKSLGWQFELVIPDGLSYIPNSGAINPDLKETIGAYDECSFTEKSKIVVVLHTGGLKNLNQENEILTFKCKVDDISAGQFYIGVIDFIVIDENCDEIPASKCRFTGATLNAQTTSSITGFVSSFNNDTDEVKIELVKDKETEASYTTFVTGNNTAYSVEGVETGNYTLYVSKKNHVTRTYEIAVTDSMSLDLKINLLGDINGDGKVNTIDVARANAHASGITILSDYSFDCADKNCDGKVNTIDVALINAHAKGVKSLW